MVIKQKNFFQIVIFNKILNHLLTAMPDKYKDEEDYVFSYLCLSVYSLFRKEFKVFLIYLFLLSIIPCFTASQSIWHYYYTVKKTDLFTNRGT